MERSLSASPTTVRSRDPAVPYTQESVGLGVVALHDDYWSRSEHVAAYAHRTLSPAEVVILARYKEALSDRVLEVGCGAGRILGYLLALSHHVVGIDISEAMLAYCRSAYPNADVRYGDSGALSNAVEGPFSTIVAADNVLDGFVDGARRRVLEDIRELLAPCGLLIFSSHNLGQVNEMSAPHGSSSNLRSKVGRASPELVARAVRRLPMRLRNRRRLGPLQYRQRDHAMLFDAETDYAILHYYIRHADQERQLRDTGYDLLECIDADGLTVPAEEGGRGTSLYYVARATS